MVELRVLISWTAGIPPRNLFDDRDMSVGPTGELGEVCVSASGSVTPDEDRDDWCRCFGRAWHHASVAKPEVPG